MKQTVKDAADMYSISAITLEQLMLACNTYAELHEALKYIDDKRHVVTVEEHHEEPRETITVKQNPDVILGCQIISALPDFYSGKCDYIGIRKAYKDNGKEHLYIIKNKVVITAYDEDGKVLGSTSTHWDNLAKWHIELLKRKINTHRKSDWMPFEVFLIV